MSGSAGTQSETEEDTSDEQSPHAPQTILEDRLDERDDRIQELEDRADTAEAHAECASRR
jgi:hypothetical protein